MRHLYHKGTRVLAGLFLSILATGCDRVSEDKGFATSPTDATSPTSAATAAAAATETGLDFPANQHGQDTRFNFNGSARPPMFPATYIWRSYHRNQAGYYGVFYWGPDATFYGANYYGPRPYPDGSNKSASTAHKWSIAANGNDPVNDANGHSTQLGYGTWRTQGFRAYDNGASKVFEFYWELPDTTKVIRYEVSRSYGSNPPASAVLTFGATPGSPKEQRYNGILRGIQVYGSKLPLTDMLGESASPLSTPAGSAGIWYLNANPSPQDISDKSGKNHHPTWVGQGRPALWTGSQGPAAPTVSLTANPTTVNPGQTANLAWSSTEATGCTAGGGWSGSKSLSGGETTVPLSSSTTFTLTCTGPGGSASQSATVTVATTPPPVPVVSLTANPASIASGSASTLSWTSSNATSCNAGGAWSGAKALNGSQSTGSISATATYSLSCTGAGGTASASATVTVTQQPPAPTVSISASPSSIESGQSSTLSWSSANATSCNASGAWSGTKAVSGSQSVAPASTSLFTLTCTGAGGSANQSVTVNVSAPPGGGITGLDFPSNGGATNDVRFRFKGGSLLPMYPATYVWRVKLRQQCGYYTTFFWGPDGAFTGTGYYGFHPYPDSPPSGCSHKWEVSVNGGDYTNDANGHSTQVGYDTWVTQAARVYASGSQKVHEFFWSLPDTTKVIRTIVYSGDSYNPPSNPALTFGTAPWAPANEHLSGVLRGIQLYTAILSTPDLLSEVNAPLSTAAGSSKVWYMNINPTPSDISDKSGKGHHPEWVTSLRPTLWNGP